MSSSRGNRDRRSRRDDSVEPRGQGRGERNARCDTDRRGDRRGQQDAQDASSEDEWADYCPPEVEREYLRAEKRRDVSRDRSRDRGRGRDRDNERRASDGPQTGAAREKAALDAKVKQMVPVQAQMSPAMTAAMIATCAPQPQALVPVPQQPQALGKDVPDWLQDMVGVQPMAMMKPPEPRVVVVPDRFVSKVVGYQGCTVKEIQMMTGTYIQMDQSRVKRDGFGVATITGPCQSNIDHAELMIKQRIDNGIATQQAYVAGKHGMGKGGRLQMGLGII